eukprot:5793568-Amphidinium_carterae.1
MAALPLEGADPDPRFTWMGRLRLGATKSPVVRQNCSVESALRPRCAAVKPYWVKPELLLWAAHTPVSSTLPLDRA